MAKKAQFFNIEETLVKVVDGDDTFIVPVSKSNKDYRLLVYGDQEMGIKPVEIKPFVAPKRRG